MNKRNTGNTMKTIWYLLVRDFRYLLEKPSFAADAQAELNVSVKALRSFKFKEKGQFFLSLQEFKCRRQVESLLKRFRFKDDLFSESELEAMAVEKFLETQKRVDDHQTQLLTQRAELVVSRAAELISEILGCVPTDEELWNECTFSRRATVGNTYLRSYLDVKLSQDEITGSLEHITWFENHVEENSILDQALTQPPFEHWRKRTRCVHTVPVEFVPKSYKSLRTIRKNTLLGAFYSSGVGKVIRRRLKKAGLNLATLQQRHRKLVLKMSVNRKLITADVTAASDSFFPALVEKLLPEQWFKLVSFGRIPNSVVGGTGCKLASFMTMGEGHTFPLQTLLFYGLLSAIQSLAGTRGLISVYGDDLIYPREIHHFVTQVFNDLGIHFNMEKTFSWEEFRESCGEDAYLGSSVRPWAPEGVEEEGINDVSYSAFLYQCINGLLERWSPKEIPTTLWYLMMEIPSTTIFQVPRDFPDYSGIRTNEIIVDPSFPWAPVVLDPPREENGWCQTLAFRHISMRPPKKPCSNQIPFIWDALRPSEQEFDEYHEPMILERVKLSTIEALPGDFEVLEDVPRLTWQYKKTKPWKSKETGFTYKYRLKPVYMEKNMNHIMFNTSKISFWGVTP